MKKKGRRFPESVLAKFHFGEEDATKGGVYLPILEDVRAKKVYDRISNTPTEEVERFECQAFFYALGRESFLVELPPDALSLAEVESIRKRINLADENGEEVTVEFKNLTFRIGELMQKIGNEFRNEVIIYGTADGLKVYDEGGAIL